MIKCRLIMKTDLRILKSKIAIENAFINLVEIKGFQNITMTEIAEKAMVNRNTIYANYGSKEGILETIVKDSFQKEFGNIEVETVKHIPLNKRTMTYWFDKLFNIIDENIELYRIILTDSASLGYLKIELKKVTKIFENVVKPNEKNKIKFSFLMTGVLGVISNYITLAIGTKEENVKILSELSLSNLKHLEYTD